MLPIPFPSTLQTSAAGIRASFMVLDPIPAPPESSTSFTPATKALLSPASSTAFPPPSWYALRSSQHFLKNISNRTPLVPPMLDPAASARSDIICAGFPKLTFPAAIISFTFSAPLFIVIPQSPSPTIWSHFVKFPSSAESLSTAPSIAFLAPSAKPLIAFSSHSQTSPPSPPRSIEGSGTFSPVMVSAICHALLVVGASSQPRIFSDSPLSTRSEVETPLMLKEVMKLPT
mmetsp:Transcript_27258/g.51645  ORF Transcript_27258/g.51645 Transcript_27258/m.51645 type:complete len:231 (-) Transcript_27258:928-1620(-)